jgi:hypothetical protein
VLAEPLDVLLILHLVLVVEDKKGFGVRICRISELEGRTTLARELLLRPHERQLQEVRPPGGHPHRVTVWHRRGPGPI